MPPPTTTISCAARASSATSVAECGCAIVPMALLVSAMGRCRASQPALQLERDLVADESRERLPPPEHDESRAALEQRQQSRRGAQRIESDVDGEPVRADARFLTGERQRVGARQNGSAGAPRRRERRGVRSELEAIAVVAEKYVLPFRVGENSSDDGAPRAEPLADAPRQHGGRAAVAHRAERHVDWLVVR